MKAHLQRLREGGGCEGRPVRDYVPPRGAGGLCSQHVRACNVPHVADQGRSLCWRPLCDALHDMGNISCMWHKLSAENNA